MCFFEKTWYKRHLLASFGLSHDFYAIVLSMKFWSRICRFKLILTSGSVVFFKKHGISATCWWFFELHVIFVPSYSAWNSGQEYVGFSWFWPVEVCFLKRHGVSATCWWFFELHVIFVPSYSAWNSGQEYVGFIWFWLVEVRFSQKHEIGATWWRFLELKTIMMSSGPAWNSGQEYVGFN